MATAGALPNAPKDEACLYIALTRFGRVPIMTAGPGGADAYNTHITVLCLDNIGIDTFHTGLMLLDLDDLLTMTDSAGTLIPKGYARLLIIIQHFFHHCCRKNKGPIDIATKTYAEFEDYRFHLYIPGSELVPWGMQIKTLSRRTYRTGDALSNPASRSTSS